MSGADALSTTGATPGAWLIPLREHCIALYGGSLAAAFIIGSYATGTATAESDLDLIAVIDQSETSRPHRARAFGEPEGYNGPELSPIILTVEELSKFPSFLLSLLDGYIVLYSRDPHSSNEPDDAKRIVAAVREYVLRNGITRVPHKGGYYWKNLPRSTGVIR